MLISESNWGEIERYLETDDRCVLPLGCTEQHAQLSLATDSILAERVGRDAAAPLGVPVFPAVAYGLKLLHSIVTRPLQWLTLVALVFGVDHFLFEGALSAWLVQSGPGVIKGLFQG